MSREDDRGVDVSGLTQKVESLEHELKMCRAELQKLQHQLNQRQQHENTDDYNEDLRQQVNKLSAELYAQQKQKKKLTDAETQTEHHTWTEIDHNKYDFGGYHYSETETEVLEDAAAENSSTVYHKNMSLCHGSKESGNIDSNNSLQPQTGNSGSIADMLRATAEEALSHTGFVFDENSGMYYDHSTGFFYDSVNQLYYDANTGIYYYYDADSGKYQFHSRIQVPSTQGLAQDHETVDEKNSQKNTIGALEHKDGDRVGERLMSGYHEFDASDVVCQKRKKSVSKCRQSCSTKHVQKKKTSKKSLHLSVKKKKTKKKRIEGDTHSEGTRRKHKKTQKVKKIHRNQCILLQHHEDKQSSTRDPSTDSELEEGEIMGSGGDESNSSTSFSLTPSSPNTEEVAPEAWPPCVRVTVVRSPALQIGSLFILTADAAATIGREKDLDHAIRIPEAEVSKSHAEVYFDSDQQCYMLVDLGSQNGTVVNGNRIFQPKVRCEPCPLSHGDEVRIGETVLSFHIHPGNDTCDGCEPGQIIAHLSRHRKEHNSGHLVGENKEMQRQRELKQMKVKYGLKNSDFEATKALNNPMYKDRAKTRRWIVGSEGTFYRDDSPSSLHVEISEVNKGRKILEKMGWKRGEGLGKDGAGIKDPIQLQVRKAQSGLGSSMSVVVDYASLSSTKTHEKWRKAQERFAETCQPPPLTSNAVEDKSFKAWVKGESTD
ncbi:angiogenic factor with G patch and FHA domains 1 [Alosa sapidissima]|uniref:angiogenic factor with G patch and FHA domains 1 n=1 Tax=Alosa sapidissima TaxID=34773 RepID=UPI001C095B62|nr:angiogenic factor with G patch and FHA domains 1 [Alosa sapidissima]